LIDTVDSISGLAHAAGLAAAWRCLLFLVAFIYVHRIGRGRIYGNITRLVRFGTIDAVLRDLVKLWLIVQWIATVCS